MERTEKKETTRNTRSDEQLNELIDQLQKKAPADKQFNHWGTCRAWYCEP